jgi:hypothetical protein
MPFYYSPLWAKKYNPIILKSQRLDDSYRIEYIYEYLLDSHPLHHFPQSLSYAGLCSLNIFRFEKLYTIRKLPPSPNLC